MPNCYAAKNLKTVLFASKTPKMLSIVKLLTNIFKKHLTSDAGSTN